jgi:hypothetical protein
MTKKKQQKHDLLIYSKKNWKFSKKQNNKLLEKSYVVCLVFFHVSTNIAPTVYPSLKDIYINNTSKRKTYETRTNIICNQFHSKKVQVIMRCILF